MKKYIIMIVAIALCVAACIAASIYLKRENADKNESSTYSKTVLEDEVQLDFSGEEEQQETPSNSYDKDNDGFVDGWY